jgi:hypothetical protein
MVLIACATASLTSALGHSAAFQSWQCVFAALRPPSAGLIATIERVVSTAKKKAKPKNVSRRKPGKTTPAGKKTATRKSGRRQAASARSRSYCVPSHEPENYQYRLWPELVAEESDRPDPTSLMTYMMTESEWRKCKEPSSMMDCLGVERDEGWNRQLLLLRLACCRRIEHLLPNKQCKAVLKALERYIEGRCTAEQLAKAKWIAHESYFGQTRQPRLRARANGLAVSALITCGDSLFHTMGTAQTAAAEATGRAVIEIEEEKGQSDLVRDIFGNPFQPVTMDSSWQTSTVVALAKAIYKEEAFDRMPILADALEDAGCTNTDILNHCRQPGVHVRGCWVLDTVLARR